MKLIAGALITALLLAGCGNKSSEIKQAKVDACSSIMFKDQTGLKAPHVTLYSSEQTDAFDKLAKLDDKYTDIAVAMHKAYLDSMSSLKNPKYEITGMNLVDYQSQIAIISQFCSVVDLG